MIAYIDENMERSGVEPIRRALTEAGAKITPEHLMRQQTQPPSARTVATH